MRKSTKMLSSLQDPNEISPFSIIVSTNPSGVYVSFDKPRDILCRTRDANVTLCRTRDANVTYYAEEGMLT